MTNSTKTPKPITIPKARPLWVCVKHIVMFFSKVQKESVHLEQKIEEISLLADNHGLREKIISRANKSHGAMTVAEVAAECKSSMMWKGQLPEWART